jgi:ectoine hydroxylase-related dioxygenase (phytanoyl-CoA dioxygenase family)
MALVDALPGDGHPPLHRLNRGFEWPERSGSLSTLTEDQAASFDRDGFVVVDPAFGAEEIAAVREEIDRREQRVEDFLTGLEDQRFGIAEAGAITFTINLAHRSELLREFVTHPVLLGLCRDLVGPDVDLYWDQAVYKKPEKPRRFPWHQDNGYTLVDPQYYLTCWIALTDATTDNGCPVVAPGLHRYGTYEHTYVEPLGWQIFDEAPREIAAPVRAGGIVVFSSLTPHMTGPNLTEPHRSDAVRKAYIVQYSPAGARIVSDDGGDSTTSRAVGDEPHTFAVLRNGHLVAP